MSLESLDLREVESAIEGILFASGEPLPIDRICLALDLDRPTAEQVLQKLGDYYAFERRGIRLVRMEDSYQLCSSPNCISAPTRRKPIKIKMSRMMPITFSAVNRPPPSFYASRGYYALRGQCSPFSGTLPSFSVMALGSRIVPSSVMRS